MNDNEKIVYDFSHNFWIKRDLFFIRQIFSENVIVETTMGLTTGLEGQKRMFHSWLNALEIKKGKIDRIISCGEQVSLRWFVREKHVDELLGISATGKCIDYLGDCYFRFRNKKIVEFRTVSTIQDAFAAEGVQLKIPPRDINYSILINAARYIRNIRLENREVEIFALKLTKKTNEQIAKIFKESAQNLQATISMVFDRLGITELNFTDSILAEGTIDIFLKIAKILNTLC